jgi:hypothetical protein
VYEFISGSHAQSTGFAAEPKQQCVQQVAFACPVVPREGRELATQLVHDVSPCVGLEVFNLDAGNHDPVRFKRFGKAASI